MANMGRRGKLTKVGVSDKIKENLVKALRGGNYTEVACTYAGISKPSFYAWFARGEKEFLRLEKSNGKRAVKESEAPYLDFFNAISAALIQAEVRAVSLIQQAAAGGEEVKHKTTTTRTPLKENGRLVFNDDGSPAYTERVVEESTLTPPSWQAAGWYLERKFPDKWGRQRLELTGPDGGPVATVGLSLDEYRKQVEARRKKSDEMLDGFTAEELGEE